MKKIIILLEHGAHDSAQVRAQRDKKTNNFYFGNNQFFD